MCFVVIIAFIKIRFSVPEICIIIGAAFIIVRKIISAGILIIVAATLSAIVVFVTGISVSVTIVLIGVFHTKKFFEFKKIVQIFLQIECLADYN
jgi:hypothetical protein